MFQSVIMGRRGFTRLRILPRTDAEAVQRHTRFLRVACFGPSVVDRDEKSNGGPRMNAVIWLPGQAMQHRL